MCFIIIIQIYKGFVQDIIQAGEKWKISIKARDMYKQQCSIGEEEGQKSQSVMNERNHPA